MPSLCLCMIVKNESAVIARCLQSVKPIIDYWVICDTGSDDNTKKLIAEHLTGAPGELHETQWVNFAHNRTEVLTLAKGKADYALIVDADMTVNVYGDFKPTLTADSYRIKYEGDLDYRQVMLVSNLHDWKYYGVTHEYIHSPTAAAQQNLDTLTLTHYCDGSGRREKINRDIALLESGLEDEPNNARYMFYLAQSYRDAGRYDSAMEWYQKRVAAGGWAEEVWYSLYQISRLTRILGYDNATVLDAALRAYEYNPARLEPLYLLVRNYREKREYRTGYLLSKVLPETPYPKDSLFIEKDVYSYKLPLEYAICCHYVGKYAEAIRVYNEMLDYPNLPPEYHQTALKNRKFALDVIYKKTPAPRSKRNRLKVLVPFHNAGHYLEKCAGSLLSQDYRDFQVIFLDDASTDGAANRLPVEDPRVTLIRNEIRSGAARNLHRALRDWCDPDDIAVLLDGDDWLASSDALAEIDRFYREYDCWVMYGQFRYSNGAYGICKPYPDRETFSRLRSVWYSSHIRTFRAGLYHKIEEQDPMYACMKDARGRWYTTAWDMAIMYPVMDLAGFDRVRYNDTVLYIYNVENPLCDFKLHRDQQLQNNLEIIGKRPFQQTLLETPEA
jgi:glycosyltransferase involved in cell wall biosynthesis